MDKKTVAPPEPDIWLQEEEEAGTADCGCHLASEYRGEEDSGNNGSPAFFFCPLHTAAADLLKVCKAARRHLSRQYDKVEELMDCGKITVDEYDMLTKADGIADQLEKAIAKAEPPKAGQPSWFA